MDKVPIKKRGRPPKSSATTPTPSPKTDAISEVKGLISGMKANKAKAINKQQLSSDEPIVRPANLAKETLPKTKSSPKNKLNKIDKSSSSNNINHVDHDPFLFVDDHPSPPPVQVGASLCGGNGSKGKARGKGTGTPKSKPHDEELKVPVVPLIEETPSKKTKAPVSSGSKTGAKRGRKPKNATNETDNQLKAEVNSELHEPYERFDDVALKVSTSTKSAKKTKISTAPDSSEIQMPETEANVKLESTPTEELLKNEKKSKNKKKHKNQELEPATQDYDIVLPPREVNVDMTPKKKRGRPPKKIVQQVNEESEIVPAIEEIMDLKSKKSKINSTKQQKIKQKTAEEVISKKSKKKSSSSSAHTDLKSRQVASPSPSRSLSPARSVRSRSRTISPAFPAINTVSPSKPTEPVFIPFINPAHRANFNLLTSSSDSGTTLVISNNKAPIVDAEQISSKRSKKEKKSIKKNALSAAFLSPEKQSSNALKRDRNDSDIAPHEVDEVTKRGKKNKKNKKKSDNDDDTDASSPQKSSGSLRIKLPISDKARRDSGDLQLKIKIPLQNHASLVSHGSSGSDRSEHSPSLSPPPSSAYKIREAPTNYSTGSMAAAFTTVASPPHHMKSTTHQSQYNVNNTLASPLTPPPSCSSTSSPPPPPSTLTSAFPNYYQTAASSSGINSPPASVTSYGSLHSPPPPPVPSAAIQAAESHNLDPHLIAQGWRKCWSERERRWYIWNKFSNQSRWDVPTRTIGISSNSGQDPLAIDHSPTSPTLNSNPYLARRTLSEEAGMASNNPMATGHQTSRKYLVSGPFDLDVTTNVSIPTAFAPAHCPIPYNHPHPDIEILRASLMFKLRNAFRELCSNRENIEPPQDAFNRWLCERQVSDHVDYLGDGSRGHAPDPIFPSSCPNEVSRALYAEIMQDIPIKLIKPKYSGDARKQLSRYAEAAKKLIESPRVGGGATAEARKIVKWNVEDAFSWIRKTLNATFEDYIDRLAHLKSQCQPHITEAARHSVEGICTKLFAQSREYARTIATKQWELATLEGIKEFDRQQLLKYKQQGGLGGGTRYCAPVQLAYPPCKLPTVQYVPDKDFIMLTYKKETIRIRKQLFYKLEHMYVLHNYDDRKCDLFLARCWTLFRRYQTYFGITPQEGHAFQSSLPVSVFECLRDSFGVTFEAFASPFNAYFRQFCSVFPDSDGYFGSRGSILNFHPVSGSLAAHPPFCEELMEAAVEHFEQLLNAVQHSSDPLSFVVFVPDWRDPVPSVVARLEASRFKRRTLTIAAGEHAYRHGFSHMMEATARDAIVKSPHATLVVFLQNDAAFARWGPTPERCDALIDAFRLGRDTSINPPLHSLLGNIGTLASSSTPNSIGHNSNSTNSLSTSSSPLTTTVTPTSGSSGNIGLASSSSGPSFGFGSSATRPSSYASYASGLSSIHSPPSD